MYITGVGTRTPARCSVYSASTSADFHASSAAARPKLEPRLIAR